MSFTRILGAVLMAFIVTAIFASVFGGFGTIIFILVTNSFSLASVTEFMLGDGREQNFSLLQLVNAGTYVGVGLAVLLGVFVFNSTINRVRKINRLEKEGMRLTATVTEITKRENSDRRVVSEVMAEWIDPRTTQRHVFRGETYGEPIVGTGGLVTVFMNHNNYKEYHMDI